MAYRLHDSLYHPWGRPESQPSFLHIRTGDVQLQHVHITVRQPLRNRAILRQRVPADIHDDFCVMLPEEWQVILNEMLHSRILQPDGIQHTALRFRNPGGRIPFPRLTGNPFDCDRTQAVQINQLPVLTA